jgi:hypothetical protein
LFHFPPFAFRSLVRSPTFVWSFFIY